MVSKTSLLLQADSGSLSFIPVATYATIHKIHHQNTNHNPAFSPLTGKNSLTSTISCNRGMILTNPLQRLKCKSHPTNHSLAKISLSYGPDPESTALLFRARVPLIFFFLGLSLQFTRIISLVLASSSQSPGSFKDNSRIRITS